MAAIWAYCRVSTSKQEQEESLEAQNAWARGYAAELGEEIRIFREQASAKSTIGRPVFSGMMAELATLKKAARPRTLVVTAMDRLSRDMTDTLVIVRTLRAHGVEVYERGYGVWASETFAQRAAIVGKSFAGEAENDARSARSRASWDRRRAQGKPTSNKVPYGLQLIGERDVPIEDSAPWVLSAFEAYDRGEGSPTIAKRFAAGAPPHTWITSKVGSDGQPIRKTRAGTKWESLRITKLLRQERYRGTIVSPELFDRVQNRLASRPRPGNRRKREYPLSGALQCSGCGRHFHGRCGGGGPKTLRDGTRRHYERSVRYYSCVCCNYQLNAVRLESAFFERVGELCADEKLLRTWIFAGQRSARSATSEADLRRLEAETRPEQQQAVLDRVFDLALKGGLTETELQRQVQRVRADFTLKRQRLEELVEAQSTARSTQRSFEEATRLLRDFRKLYADARYDLKREFVNTIVTLLGGVKASKGGLIWAQAPPPSPQVKKPQRKVSRASRARRR